MILGESLTLAETQFLVFRMKIGRAFTSGGPGTLSKGQGQNWLLSDPSGTEHSPHPLAWWVGVRLPGQRPIWSGKDTFSLSGLGTAQEGGRKD